MGIENNVIRRSAVRIERPQNALLPYFIGVRMGVGDRTGT